jgi:hypothetical protein
MSGLLLVRLDFLPKVVREELVTFVLKRRGSGAGKNDWED